MQFANQPPKPRHTGRNITLIALAVLLGLCGLIGGIAGAITFATSPPTPPALSGGQRPDRAGQPDSAGQLSGKAGPAVKSTVGGDDVVHVGQDIPAGTYRAVTAVTKDALCYWTKSSDAEGANIIDNGIPTGGRPQVTLKAGQWFTSRGCPTWSKVG